MVFDTRRSRIVMFGGWGASGLLNDTWAWDGQRWTQLSDRGPAPRFAARMAYDANRDRVVLFGGRGQSSDFGDTWEFDGQVWRQLEVAGPSIRNIHEMVFDPRSRSVLLFGGYNAPKRFDDLWSFDGDAWHQIPRTDAVLPRDGIAPPGPYAVGYRLIKHWDPSRATQPASDFEGRAFNGERATPMQVSIWYPATAGGSPVTIGYYRALFEVRSTLAEPAEAEVSNAGAALQAEARFQLGLDLPRIQATAIAAGETLARRDAPPADGRFPLIVGGLEGAAPASGLAEYLASHGYVVLTSPSLPRTATEQVTQPQVALETQTRNLEVVYSIARELPFADARRIALIGYNFDGMAALAHQMRNMTASAVVSMDGWEAKDSARILQASPYYDVTRVRVPYLLFAQANPPSSQLAFDSVIVDQLKYAERYAFVVKDMEHAELLGDQRIFPQLSRERRIGYDFVYRTVRTFLDAFVRGDSTARASLNRNAVTRGYPAWLATTEVRRPALRAVPTADEVEAIAMSGDIAKLTSVYRAAVQDNPAIQLFNRRTLALFAFRFAQRGQRESAIALHQLGIEAFPRSAIAQNDLGNAYRDAGNMELAAQHWRRALEMVDQDPEIETPAERAQSRANIEQKLRAAQR
jgi:tetratricopeptide (TPR) repeat protein